MTEYVVTETKVKKRIPILFQNKAACCGCSACVNLCSQNAITMQEDEWGFIYPVIDAKKCMGCGKCKKTCAFQYDNATNIPLKTYAAVAKDLNLLEKSASGGVFAALAGRFIRNGGVVFGAAFDIDWKVHHIGISQYGELYQLQGSKYTQSNIESTFIRVREILERGEKVLFSGTPCQIAGLYGYLGRRYQGLYTIDIICHGVPNHRMLREYIKRLELRIHGRIQGFWFRDKSLGWGKNGRVFYEKNGLQRTRKLWNSASSFLYFFSKGWINRESCYQCKYACMHRTADLTLGDYWGIEGVHPDYVGCGGWDESKGISVMLVNTEKGMELINKSADLIDLKTSDFGKAAEGNSQLLHPCERGIHDVLMDEYRNGGWAALEKRFHSYVGLKKYSSQIKYLIPLPVKRFIKKRRWMS